MPIDRIGTDGIENGAVVPADLSTGGPSWTTSGAVILQGGDTGANGIGITFPATQSASTNANTLDDYEEGLWTPALTSVGATFTYPRGQYGSYCKIGGLVYAQFYIGANPSGTTSNACSLTGLPFVSANLSPLAQASGAFWVATTTPLALTQDNNAASITIWRQNAGITPATAADCASGAGTGSYLVGMIVYRAA
jgi:hypothetical protein